MKRLIIPRADLPEKNPYRDEYLVRYRLASNDRNQVSHWSPIYKINPGISYSTNTISVAPGSSYVTVVWDAVRLKGSPNTEYYDSSDLIGTEKEYDVWVRWSKDGLGDWSIYSRLEGNTISLNIPNEYYYQGNRITDAPNEFSVEIRQAVSVPMRIPSVRIFYSVDSYSV